MRDLIDGYMSVSRAAARLKLSRQRVYDLLKRHPPKDTRQTPYGLMISKADVERLINRSVRNGRPPAVVKA